MTRRAHGGPPRLPSRAFRALVDRLPDPRVALHRRRTLDDGARLPILGIQLVRERLRAQAPRATEALSGLAFSSGHISLAATVTDAGSPVLVFTAYEGLVAAALRARFGLVAATVAHGGGIFIIASGLF